MMQKNNVQIPRFFYRDTQKAMAEIQASIEQCGSVREAMTQRIAPYAGLLPEEYTAEQVIKQIEETASMFCAAEAQITSKDIRSKLEEAIGQYTEEEAFYYLSILETTVSAMDASADDRLILPDAETIQAEIEEKLANPGELSLAERIDRLVDSFCENGMKTFVFAGGNDQILEAVCSDKAEAPQVVVELLNEGMEKADFYAMAACACYEQILQGKIDGVTAQNADPRMVTVLVSAGLSKGSILKRLMRGEIDRDLARDLLEKLELVVKWMLAVLYQVFMGAVTFVVLTHIILAFVESSTVLCAILVGAAALIAAGVTLLSEEEGECISETVMDLTKYVLSLPVRLGKLICNQVKSWQSSRPAQPLPQQPVQA